MATAQLVEDAPVRQPQQPRTKAAFAPSNALAPRQMVRKTSCTSSSAAGRSRLCRAR